MCCFICWLTTRHCASGRVCVGGVPPSSAVCDVCVPGRRGRHADAPGIRPARSYSPPRRQQVPGLALRRRHAGPGLRASPGGRKRSTVGAARAAAPPSTPPRGCTRGCALAAPLPIASLRRVEVRAAERTERGETAPERGSGTGRAGRLGDVKYVNVFKHMYSRAL